MTMNSNLVVTANDEFAMEVLEVRLELGLFSWIGHAFRSIGHFFKKNFNTIKSIAQGVIAVISLS